MKVLVTGTKEKVEAMAFHNKMEVFCSLNHPTEILTGDSPGVDRLAGEYAEMKGIPYRRFLAEWELNGQSAGFLRGDEMLAGLKPGRDAVVIFHVPKDGDRGSQVKQSYVDRVAHSRGLKVVHLTVPRISEAKSEAKGGTKGRRRRSAADKDRSRRTVKQDETPVAIKMIVGLCEVMVAVVFGVIAALCSD